MLRLDTARKTIPALRSGCDLSLMPAQGPPASDACSADAEPRRYNPVISSSDNRSESTKPDIDGKVTRYDNRPPHCESLTNVHGYPQIHSGRKMLNLTWTLGSGLIART